MLVKAGKFPKDHNSHRSGFNFKAFYSKKRLAKLTAIVIDDDPDTVMVFSEYLQIRGISVVGKGYDGMDAVRLYEELKPDIVFLDVMMIKYDGFYALERIKAIEPDSIVIMVTADLTRDTDARLTRLNASAIAYKPYEIDRIMETVNRLFAPVSSQCTL